MFLLYYSLLAFNYR